MGCFLACFRLREPDRKRWEYPATPPRPSASKERLVSKNQLASVLLCEDRDSPCEKNSGRGSVDGELKNEAHIFKACGALLETPAEIQKASLKIVSENKENELSSEPPTNKILPRDESTDHTKALPTVLCDEENFLVCKPRSSITNEMLAKRENNNILASLIDETESSDSENDIMSTESKISNNGPGPGSVLNAGIFSVATPQIASHSSNCQPNSSNCVATPQIASRTQDYVLKPSVYPTPLKLTDEMQTPATVFPTNFDKLGAVKNVRIRSQYVYPILNPVANLSELKAVTEESQTSFSEDNVQRWNSITQTQQEKLNAASSCNMDHKHQNSQDTSTVALTLSQWLKPSISEEERRRNWEAVAKEKSPSGKSPGKDMPIIGLVASHWNGDDSSHFSPKWWDGNGIPNSTNKYKEDQRVSWHATPFEERLEKALSDEKLFPERKAPAMAVKFCDEDE